MEIVSISISLHPVGLLSCRFSSYRGSERFLMCIFLAIQHIIFLMYWNKDWCAMLSLNKGPVACWRWILDN